MLRTIGSVPVKTRVPLAVWAFAGSITLFSMVSSLLQVVAGPGHDFMQSAAEQATVSQPKTLASKMQHASVNW
jgi:hypothetical protein